MTRLLKIFAISYLITYIFLTIFWVSGSPNGCTPGQEIDEGCRIAFPATFVLLAWLNIPASIVTTVIASAITLIRKKPSLRKKS